MRIAVVNDMRMAPEVLKRIITGSPDHELAWTALDGKEAVEQCAADRPDLILMDLIMPVMDGVATTRALVGVIEHGIGGHVDQVAHVGGEIGLYFTGTERTHGQGQVLQVFLPFARGHHDLFQSVGLAAALGNRCCRRQ